MSRLELNDRQRAMLTEMGVAVWPAAAKKSRHPAPVVAAEAQVQVLQAQAPALHAPTPQPTRVVMPVSQPVVTAAAIPQTITPLDVGHMDWATLEQTVAQCQACGLCQHRKNTVFGTSAQQAPWMIVGEAPGENEDRQGLPFVGAAGQLLDNMLRAAGLSRDSNVYIANVLKCRPPGNRNPTEQEIAQCQPYLKRQIELLQPKVIVALGRFAAHTLLHTTEPLGKLRGQVHEAHGRPVIVSYHPAYLLRNLPEKARAWSDWCFALDFMQRQPATESVAQPLPADLQK